MKSPQSLLTVALALAPLASAWPGWLPDVDSLVVRQDDATTTEPAATETNTADADQTSATDEATTTADNNNNEPETTNLNTGGRTATSTGTGTRTGTKTGSTSKSSTHSSFDAQDGAGGVAMITPATTDATSLYRIDNPDPITWVWNYTSLQGTPDAIDVYVSCSTATATWTLTQNMTFAPTATYTWDSAKFQSDNPESQLLTAEYTLVIIDSDSSIDATAEAGYLAPFDGYNFGMYTSRPYEALGQWKCATCSGAMGDVDRKALGFAITMSMITVLSFTWYVVGFAALL